MGTFTAARRAAALALAGALLAGCRQNVDLSAVRTIAKAAQDARASYEALAADYFQSCVRKVELKSIGRAMTRSFPVAQSRRRGEPAPTPAPVRGPYAPGLQPSQLSRATPETLAALTPDEIKTFDDQQVDAVVVRSDIAEIEGRLSVEQQGALNAATSRAGTPSHVYSCKGASDVADQWKRRNDILVGYFTALSKLAGGAGDEDRYGIAGLAQSLRSNDVFANDKQTQAFQKLADDVLRGIFDWKRRDALANDLAKGEPYVDEIVAQLSSVAATNYKFQIRQERDALHEFRKTNLLFAKRGLQAFEVYQYAKTLKAEDAALDDREAAADTYVASLGKLTNAHAAVVDAVSRNDIQAGVAAAKLYYDDLHGDVQTIHHAFSGGT
jgi:hypothetical protein